MLCCYLTVGSLALCGESFYNDKIPPMLAWLADAKDVNGAYHRGRKQTKYTLHAIIVF